MFVKCNPIFHIEIYWDHSAGIVFFQSIKTFFDSTKLVKCKNEHKVRQHIVETWIDFRFRGDTYEALRKENKRVEQKNERKR